MTSVNVIIWTRRQETCICSNQSDFSCFCFLKVLIFVRICFDVVRKMVEELAGGQAQPEDDIISLSEDPEADEFIRKALKVVEDNMDNEFFGSADFAKAMCLSRSNLYLKMNSGPALRHCIL